MMVDAISIIGTPTFSPINPSTRANLENRPELGQWERYDHDRTRDKSTDFWYLTEPLIISYRLRGVKTTFTLTFSPGWITDFGSVPKWARGIVNHTDPKWLEGFLLHDAYYACTFSSRSYADNLLLACGKYRKASLVSVSAVGVAVRLGGASAWKNSRVAWRSYERQWVTLTEVQDD
jgi:hypothetical protein